MPQALRCDVCDTAYYYNAAARDREAGLLFKNPFDGYRSYFVPLVIAVVARLAGRARDSAASTVVRYTYGVSILFWLLSVALMTWLARRAAAKDFVLTTVATLLNPFLLVYVPFRAAGGRADGVLPAAPVPVGRREGLGARDGARRS